MEQFLQWWQSVLPIVGPWIMIAVSCVLIYLAIVKQYEPLLLLPIAFGMLLANLPGSPLMAKPTLGDGGQVSPGGLLYYLSQGVDLGIYPPLIFLGIGVMIDFGPLIADPRSLLLGAAAQMGIFVAFFGALLLGFSPQQAASIGIIGGADGPTAIFTCTKLAPELLTAVAIAAYSYMALIPIIQPFFMRILTTKEERMTVMKQLRTVSKAEKILFPIVTTIIICIIFPDATPLIGMLMFGNLMRECGVVQRLSKTAENDMLNIITIFLGLSVGAKAAAGTFLTPETLGILLLGVFAFAMSTVIGVLFGKLLYILSGKKINPLIGSAGVSAVPMAARVSQTVAREANPHNFILMHAMGPNVAGVIGSAIVAAVFLGFLA